MLAPPSRGDARALWVVAPWAGRPSLALSPATAASGRPAAVPLASFCAAGVVTARPLAWPSSGGRTCGCGRGVAVLAGAALRQSVTARRTGTAASSACGAAFLRTYGTASVSVRPSRRSDGPPARPYPSGIVTNCTCAFRLGWRHSPGNCPGGVAARPSWGPVGPPWLLSGQPGEGPLDPGCGSRRRWPAG